MIRRLCLTMHIYNHAIHRKTNLVQMGTSINARFDCPTQCYAPDGILRITQNLKQVKVMREEPNLWLGICGDTLESQKNILEGSQALQQDWRPHKVSFFFRNILGFRGGAGDHIDLWDGRSTRSYEAFGGCQEVWTWKL